MLHRMSTQELVEKIAGDRKDGLGTHIHGAIFDGENLSEVDCNRVMFKGCSFNSAILNHASFSYGSMSNCGMRGADCYGARFEQSVLTDLDWQDNNLTGCNFDGSIIGQSKIENCMMNRATLIGSKIRGGNWNGNSGHAIHWKGASLSQVNMDRNSFRQSVWNDATVIDTSMKDTDIGVSSWLGTYVAGVDFEGASFARAEFLPATLNYARIVVSRFDERGYTLIVVPNGPHDVRVFAGCREYDLTDALDHWGSKHYYQPKVGKAYVRAILMAVEILGIELEPMEPEKSDIDFLIVGEELG